MKSTIKSKMEEAGLGECTDVVDQVMARLSDPASASMQVSEAYLKLGDVLQTVATEPQKAPRELLQGH